MSYQLELTRTYYDPDEDTDESDGIITDQSDRQSGYVGPITAEALTAVCAFWMGRLAIDNDGIPHGTYNVQAINATGMAATSWDITFTREGI